MSHAANPPTIAFSSPSRTRWLSAALLFLWMGFSATALALEPKVTELQGGLDHPWSLAFLPNDQGMLITERSGQLRRWQVGKGLSEPIHGVPAVYASGQGGLLEVALAPDFASSRRVYLSYAEADANGNAGTAVGYGRLSDDGRNLEHFQVIFRQMPKLSTGNHFGGKLAFDPQGRLFVTLGENNQRATAQQQDKLQGKLVRLTADGQVPADNPYVNNRQGTRAEIWSYGHRNPQGLAFNPVTGTLWENEHGPRGGDEINFPMAARNYGWPVATHGINYSGLPIPEAKGSSVPGMIDPVYVWKKSPGVSGMAFYQRDRFPAWKNSVFIGALAERNLIRLSLEGDRILSEERLLSDRNERIREVRVGPDGYLYVLTDAADGKLLKIGLE